MRKSLFKGIVFGLAVAAFSSNLHAIGFSNFYFGLHGSKLLHSADSKLNIGSIDSGFRLSNGGTDWDSEARGDPFYSPVGLYTLDFDDGHAFGLSAGFNIGENLFFEGEFSHRERNEKVLTSWPDFLSNNGQNFESIIKTWSANLGYCFNLGMPISPFVSIGLGIANIDLEGEFRASVGSYINPESEDFYEIHKNSEFRGRFEASSDAKFAGNFKAGIAIPAGRVSALISYRYTSVIGHPRLELESLTPYKNSHSWSFDANAAESDDDFEHPVDITALKNDYSALVINEGAEAYLAEATGQIGALFNSYSGFIEEYSYSDHAIEISVRALIG